MVLMTIKGLIFKTLSVSASPDDTQKGCCASRPLPHWRFL